MNEPKFTPGPWTVQPPMQSLPSRWLVTSKDGVVCDVGLNCGPQPSNARLIAAAPDLLAACEKIEQWLPRYINLYGDNGLRLADFIATCRAAIAKARGEAES